MVEQITTHGEFEDGTPLVLVFHFGEDAPVDDDDKVYLDDVMF